MIRLGVNIDHVATVRNARGGAHPDPVDAALAAIAAGADGITAHLREDRRHIRDADIDRLRAAIGKPLNLEMAATGGDGRQRAARAPPCRLHRAGTPGRGDDRGRAGRGRADASAAPDGRRAARRGHPGVAVHRPGPAPVAGGGGAGRRHRGAAHRRLCRGPHRRVGPSARAAAATAGWAWNAMPATASPTTTSRPSRDCLR